jgi:predicted component of type VI protein secretion system
LEKYNDYITVKQLADELKMTKQGVNKYIKLLPTDLQPVADNQKRLLSVETADYIRDLVATNKSKSTTVVGKFEQKMQMELPPTVVTTPENIKIMFQQLDSKDRQIEKMQNQIDELHKMLYAQQQLSAKNLEQSTVLQLELEKEKSKSIWKKIFGR